MNSPKGTPKNRKSSGKRITEATCSPSTAGTASTSSPTHANCDAALTSTRSDTSHTALQAAMPASSQGCGRGTRRASVARWRQMSQAVMGGTRKACAKVSERYQMPTMPIMVSR